MVKSLVFALIVGLASPLAADPSFWRHEWPDTDFERTSIPNWVEIMSGGPPKDGIPALSDPQFLDLEQVSGIADAEPVITVSIDNERPRAYPIRYLTWHEIVNDQIGDIPVAVTFCPLCNSALTFDRRVAGQVLTFGVSGKLRNSDMIMYDRETQSWWQQAIGTGVVGEMTGAQLDQLPSWMESFARFKAANPDGIVMAEPNWRRAYGSNPYVGYDSAHRPFLYSGENPPHGIAPLVRVVRVGDRAWPLDRLRTEGRINEAGVVLDWQAGQASALDSRDISKGRDVGNVRVFDSEGAPVPHDVMFAFAYHAFWPDGLWMLGD